MTSIKLGRPMLKAGALEQKFVGAQCEYGYLTPLDLTMDAYP